MWITGYATFHRKGSAPGDVMEVNSKNEWQALTRDGNVLKASNGAPVFQVVGDELIALVDGVVLWP